jgi:hypothetical protein
MKDIQEKTLQVGFALTLYVSLFLLRSQIHLEAQDLR